MNDEFIERQFNKIDNRLSRIEGIVYILAILTVAIIVKVMFF